jgi:hypothetical protein
LKFQNMNESHKPSRREILKGWGLLGVTAGLGAVVPDLVRDVTSRGQGGTDFGSIEDGGFDHYDEPVEFEDIPPLTKIEKGLKEVLNESGVVEFNFANGELYLVEENGGKTSLTPAQKPKSISVLRGGGGSVIFMYHISDKVNISVQVDLGESDLPTLPQ